MVLFEQYCESSALIGILLAKLNQSSSNRLDSSSTNIGRVLPVRNPREPSERFPGFVNGTSQISSRHVARIGGIMRNYRLAYDQLLHINFSLCNLHQSCSVEWTTCLFHKLLVRVILGVALVVELDDVEVDEVTHCFVDRNVCPIFVEFLLEVRTLRAVSHNMVGNHLSQSFSKSNDPLFSSSCLHCGVVLPINISPIKVVLDDKIAKSSSACLSILFLSGWKFSRPKCAH